MTKLEILKQKMEKWIHPTDEELIEAIREYIVRIEGIGSALSGDFIDMISNLQGNTISTPKKRIVTSDDDFIESIWELLPKQNHLVGGQPFKPSKKDFADRLVKFNAEYHYDQEVLYNALKMYISEVSDCSEQDRQYKKTLLYFIWKQGEGSRLSAYCDKVLQGEVKEHSYSKMI